MNNPAGGSGRPGIILMLSHTDHAFARFVDTTVVVAFAALSFLLAGATAIVGA